MSTRESFRAALADIQEYVVGGLARRPAFTYSLAQAARKDRVNLKGLPWLGAPVPRPGTAARAASDLADGSTSSVRLVHQALEVVRQRDRELNAFAYVAPESALLQQAEVLDEERRSGNPRSSIHGIPISVKDVIHVKGMPTTASSRVMQGCVPSEDATAVRLLREAGALIVGKTHTHEFALGVTTPQSRNPWDTSRDPGGSSGGSAISVATGMSLLSLGTDTRASIRVPAALCGIVGYKPTYGLVSTDGVVTLSWSMDHTGLQARTTQDVAMMMNVVQGMDPMDQAFVDRPKDDYTAYLFRNVKGLRVGWAVNSLHGVDPEVLHGFDAAVSGLGSLGVDVVESQEPSQHDFRQTTSHGLIISRCEAAAFHRSFPRDSSSLYTQPVFEQLDEASQVRAVDYLNAQRFRSEFQERMLRLFESFDALVLPTTKVPAPKSAESGRYHMILSENCIPWSFIGFPAISVPCGFTRAGLPLGLQFVTAPFNDGVLFALGSALELAQAADNNGNATG